MDEDWESNAMLRERKNLIPCNIAEADETENYFWVLPLADVPGRPNTSLLGELRGETSNLDSLPMVKWCDWQTCICRHAEEFIQGRFQFLDDSEQDNSNLDDAAAEDNPSFPLMIEAEGHGIAMLGDWDGVNRDENSGLPLVTLFTFPTDSE